MVKIKFLKKFKKYNMYVDNNNLYLICKDEEQVEENVLLNDQKLLSDTLKLGEDINHAINLFYKEEIKSIREKFILSGIDEKDVKKIKIHNNSIQYNKTDLKSQNDNIVHFIKDICLKVKQQLDKKDIFYEVDEALLYNYEIYNFNFFENIYKEIYNFLKNNNIDIEKLAEPEFVSGLITWEVYAIDPPKKTINKYPNIDNIKTKDYLKNQLIILLELLEKNKEIIDYTPIIEKINYIPLDIKKFFDYIIENNPNNKYSHDIYNKIIQYIDTYGVPFWTEDIKTPRSNINYNVIDISLNTLILICLSIFTYTEIWKKFRENSKKYDTFDEFNFLNYTLNIINVNYLYTDIETEVYEKISDSITELDTQIRYIYNKMFDYSLKIYRDRIWDKKAKIFYTEYTYDNYIIGVWDIFFKNYFGHDNIFSKIEHNTCIQCNKEFTGKGHLKNTMCNNCFDERKKLKNREKVKRHRDKKGLSDGVSDKI